MPGALYCIRTKKKSCLSPINLNNMTFESLTFIQSDENCPTPAKLFH